MKESARVASAAMIVVASVLLFLSAGEADADEGLAPLEAAPTLEAARGRARLLHEVIHGALQVTHRDFYREDEGLTLPSRSLEDVFAVLAQQWNVNIRWLAVNAEAMNVEHRPQDDFEKRAVEALASGQKEFEAVEGDRYRHAGAVRLASQCLKCHLPNRTSTEDRAAGLVIDMPFGELHRDVEEAPRDE